MAVVCRKKKKKKEKDKMKQILMQEVKAGGDSSCDSSGPGPSTSRKHTDAEIKTKAELAFEKIKEQRVMNYYLLTLQVPC